ncbi:MAG: hypothetical protein KAJ51_11695 [Thermoplasmata archaeon]|nr:hypothetical protein [Thermoplasmata archaeon]
MHWFGISSYNKVCNALGYPIKERVEATCECGGIPYKWGVGEDGAPERLVVGFGNEPEPVMETIITRKYISRSDKTREVVFVSVDDYG